MTKGNYLFLSTLKNIFDFQLFKCFQNLSDSPRNL